MSGMWDWPGARWWRCDLHLHSPASHDFRDTSADAAAWLMAVHQAKIHVAAVTDHDSGAFIDAIRNEQAATGGHEIVVFSGVEVTTSDRVHLLALFSERGGTATVSAFLGSCGVPADAWGLATAHATESFERCLTIAAEHHAVCIAPHADRVPRDGNPSTGSLLVGIGSPRLERILASAHLHAAEICEDDPVAHRKLRGYDPPDLLRRDAPGLALVEFSDAHALADIGRRSTWIKMTQPTCNGLLLALGDGADSVRIHGDREDPNATTALSIESLTIENAKLVGRSEPFVLMLNPWLNSIIGGRGVGKSTLVHMLRLALRRVDDLPASMKDDFEKFAQVPSRRGAPGALCENTVVRVEYRKAGVQFRASWSTDGSATSLEQFVDGGWGPAMGTVRQRLPVAIYSQDEIHEIARHPRALLRIIDESEAVDRPAWQGLWNAEHSRFLALRAQMRQLASGLEREDNLRGELDDIAHKLAVFERAEHNTVLREFQRRRRQRVVLDRWLEEMAQVGRDIQAAADGAVVDDLPEDAFDPEDDVDQSVVRLAHDWAGTLRARVEEVREISGAVNSMVRPWHDRLVTEQWSAAAQAADRAYERLATWLREEGVDDPEQYAQLVQRRQIIDQRLSDMVSSRQEIARVRAQADVSLRALRSLRNDLSARRGGFLGEVLEGNQLVQIDLDPLGDIEGLNAGLHEILGLDVGTFEDELGQLADLLGPSTGEPASRTDAIKDCLRRLADGEKCLPLHGRFRSRLQALTPETLDRIEAWFPDDHPRARYSAADGRFRAIEQGSPGQRNAAVLAFLLSYGEQPMIIDQPENDLDNRLISELIVAQLRASKLRRQLVVVTHNANIVVNADAELVVALHAPAGEVRIETQGGLQDGDMRDTVCEIMEGGREAFERRYHRIGERAHV